MKAKDEGQTCTKQISHIVNLKSKQNESET